MIKSPFPAIVLILTLISNQIVAVSGYCVKLTGDTVNGKFYNVPDIGNPSTVEFTANGASEPVQLTPQTVKSFRVGNYEYFLSYNGSRKLNPLNSADANVKSDSSEIIHTFLREIGETNGLL